MPKRALTRGQGKAMRIIGRVLAQQGDQEPNRWYAYRKREAAKKAFEASKCSSQGTRPGPTRR